MIRNSSLVLVAILGSLAAGPALAEGVVFRFTRAVYGDDRDIKLASPEGVGCGDDGRLVVADTGNARLLAYSLGEGMVTLVKEVKVREIRYPTRVVLDEKGNTWVLDRRARKIARLGKGYAFGGWVEPKDGAPFMPVSFVVTASGNLVAIDATGPSVVELDQDGRALRRVPLPAGEFTDLWVDPQGTVFALDAVGGRVWTARKDDASFKALTRSLKDEMKFPTQIVSNGRGRLFVVDQNGMDIGVLGIDGSYQGRQLAMGWTPGLLYYPTQLCVTSKGVVAIADRGNHRLQVFTTLE